MFNPVTAAALMLRAHCAQSQTAKSQALDMIKKLETKGFQSRRIDQARHLLYLPLGQVNRHDFRL